MAGTVHVRHPGWTRRADTATDTHVIYGQALTGTPYDAVVLHDLPETGGDWAWVNEVLSCHLTPGAAITHWQDAQ